MLKNNLLKIIIMEYPILNFFTYSDLRNHELRQPENLTKQVTIVLAASELISFLPESEIFYIQRTACLSTNHRGEISANIMIADEYGKIPDNGLCLRPRQLLARTRDIYERVFQSAGILPEIFPVVVPQVTSDKLSQIVQEEGQYITIDGFPTNEQIAPIEILLKAYINANPDPFLRLAIVNSSPGYVQHTEKTFQRIAEKYSMPTRLKIT